MVRSTDRPAMTIAVDLGCKATKQTNKNKIIWVRIHIYKNLKKTLWNNLRYFYPECLFLLVYDIY